MLNIAKLEDDLSDLPMKYIVLVTGSGKEYQDAKFKVLENLCNTKKLYGIYVSQKIPIKKLLYLMRKMDIDTERLFFIDVTGKKTGRDGKYLYIHPKQISDLAIAIEGWIRTLPKGEKFLFLDEFSALFIYNSLGSVKKFRDFLIKRMKLWGLRDIFISVERGYNLKLFDKIYSICDKIIEAQSIGK